MPNWRCNVLFNLLVYYPPSTFLYSFTLCLNIKPWAKFTFTINISVKWILLFCLVHFSVKCFKPIILLIHILHYIIQPTRSHHSHTTHYIHVSHYNIQLTSLNISSFIKGLMIYMSLSIKENAFNTWMACSRTGNPSCSAIKQ